MTEPVDLTSTVLKEIRDEMRGMRVEMRDVKSEVHEIRAELRTHSEQLVLQSDRMELVETTLRDLAEQVLMMGRGLKHAIESRARDDARLDDHERRLQKLELDRQGA